MGLGMVDVARCTQAGMRYSSIPTILISYVHYHNTLAESVCQLADYVAKQCCFTCTSSADFQLQTAYQSQALRQDKVS